MPYRIPSLLAALVLSLTSILSAWAQGVPDIASSTPNGGTYNYNTVVVGEWRTASIGITNTGTANLTGINVVLDGPDTADFAMTTPGEHTVVPGSGTSFNMRFVPKSAGSKSLLMKIYSNDPDESPYLITLTGNATASEIVVEQPLGTDVADGATVSFGDVPVNTSHSLTFTMKNTGTATLHGGPFSSGFSMSKDGTHAANFTVTTSPATSVAAGGSTTFVLRFAPNGPGPFTANLHITNNDYDEQPFDIILQGTGVVPDIALEEPAGVDFLVGGSSRSFGNVSVGGSSAPLTFTARNAGTGTLDLLSLTKGGIFPNDYEVTTPAITTLASGASTTFSVTFKPTAGGSRPASFTLRSSDVDEEYLSLDLNGTGTAPEITVQQPEGTDLVDGGSPLSFGARAVGASSSLTFTVSNPGQELLTGLAITKDGDHAAEFVITQNLPVTQLAPGTSATFTVQFTPGALGQRQAALHIASNDADESPFDIPLSGEGVTPDIRVEAPPGTAVASDRSIDFGPVPVGSYVTRTIEIKNLGTTNLTGIWVNPVGPNTADFEMTSPPTSTVVPGGSTTFTVRFIPKQPGARSLLLQINSSDPDESPYLLTLTGTGTAPEIVLEQTGGAELQQGDAIDFGDVPYGATVSRWYTLKNTGSAALSGIALTKSGQNPEVFNIIFAPSGTLAPGATNDFLIRYTASAGGPFTASMNIASNDPDENPLTIVLKGNVLEPEIVVEEPEGVDFREGGNSRSFGDVRVGETSPARTFTVRNVGTLDLSFSLVMQSVWNGHPDSDYVIIRPTKQVIAPGESTTFGIAFRPLADGARSDRLMISGTATNEKGLTVNLNGTGLGPEISVLSTSGYDYQDGRSDMSFSEVSVGANRSLTLTILNRGQEPLTGLAITRDGPHADEYQITQGPETELAPGAGTTFTVQFAPAGLGTREAALYISSNDPNENPFDLELTGEGLIPEIRVEMADGTEIVSGGTYDFGTQEAGKKLTLPLKIINTGASPLQLWNPGSSGTHANDFFIARGFSSSWVAPGSSVTWSMNFLPRGAGPRNATLKLLSTDADESSFEIVVSGTGLQSQFVVEQPVGTPVVSDEGRDLGFVARGRSTNLTFTITNPGTIPLTIDTSHYDLFFSGTHALEFSIAAPPASPIPPGGTTTMTLRHVGNTDGLRKATLNISHNAGYPSPAYFYLPLTATVVQPAVSFSGALFLAQHGDAQGMMTLTRTHAEVPATVAVETLDGLAQAMPPIAPAVAGADYTPLSAQAGVVDFAVGETEKTVAIPLLAPASGADATRHLRLKLRQHTGTVQLTAPSEATLRILGADDAKPTLTLTNPAAGKVSASWPLLVSGKAGDAKGIERVEVKLNDAAPVLASLGSTADPKDVPFTAPITPGEGANVLVVTAYDLRGNSTAVSRSFTFTRRQLLTMESVGGGFSLEMTATPAASASPLSATEWQSGQTGPSLAQRTSMILAGTKLKLVAKPAKDFIFKQWSFQTAEPAGLVVTGDVITFTMPNAHVTVRAEFVPLPFHPGSGESTSVHALLTPPQGAESSPFAHQGYLTGKLTPTGSFTGKLFISGQTVPLTAQVYAGAPSLFTTAGQKRHLLPLPRLPGLSLNLRPTGESAKTFTAEVVDAGGTVVSSGLARWATYSSAKKVPSALLNSATKGTYTAYLGYPAFDPSSAVPQGFGYATMTLSNTGAISLTGMLADGTAITMSTALLAGNEAPIFMQLPTPGATTKLGLVTGLLTFDPTAVQSDVRGNWRWFRPATTNPKVLLYPAGWPTGPTLEVIGTLYSPVVTAQSALGLGPVVSGQGNGRLSFTWGKLTNQVNVTNFSLKGNTVVKVPASDASFTLALTPATGLFNGTFTPNWLQPAATKPAFKGVILQKVGASGGYGFFLNNAKAEPAPESGSVMLWAP